jgi:hypothetical protein
MPQSSNQGSMMLAICDLPVLKNSYDFFTDTIKIMLDGDELKLYHFSSTE